MKVLAPAKINLYLKILGKRPDGYHELETLMCAVDLMDELEFEPRAEGIHLKVEGANLPAGPDNLVWRAAKALLDKSRKKAGANIILRKQIPAGGGLGGGSSDAASTLLALNKLWNLNFDARALSELAAQLGSDVAFFLQPHPAICTGRGEKIRPTLLKNLPWAVLFNPGFGVPSPWAYKTYAQNPQSGAKGKTFYWSEPDQGISLQNDLEPAVFSKYLWIAETKSWLQKNPLAKDALMSGSGATVFALVADEMTGKLLADEAQERLGEKTWIRVVQLLAKVEDFRQNEQN